MKKFLSTLIAVLAVAVLFAFAGCETREPGDPLEPLEIEQVYSICYAFTASEDKASMKDYLDKLKADGVITFEGSESQYGFYITSVLGVSSKTVSSTANSYTGYDWTVYTTLKEKDGVAYAQDDSTFVYGGITLYKGAYGVSGIPCVKGETYALVYELSSSNW